MNNTQNKNIIYNIFFQTGVQTNDLSVKSDTVSGARQLKKLLISRARHELAASHTAVVSSVQGYQSEKNCLCNAVLSLRLTRFIG